MSRLSIAASLLLFLTATPATALDVQIKDVRTGSSILHAAIELRDLIPDRFKRLLDENGTLHLRLQAELWESRPVWDRLVYPAVVRAGRIARDSLPPNPMAVTVDLGHANRIVTSGRYYVHAVATLGTLAERDPE